MRDFNSNGEIVGRPFQAVNEQSLTQKYPIGIKYESYGKIWRYCRAAATISPGKRGCPNLATSAWTGTDDSYGIGSDGATVTGIAGSNYVDVTHRAHAHTIDEFQGGIMNVYPAAPLDVNIYQFRVIGNDADDAATLVLRAYLDPPLPVALTAVPVDLNPSPYMNVGAPASVGTGFSVVVIPEITVTSGYFFWGQTHGPCWVTPNAGWTTVSVRECEFHTNGTIKAAAGVALQRAGYLLHGNAADDDACIMLMLE